MTTPQAGRGPARGEGGVVPIRGAGDGVETSLSLPRHPVEKALFSSPAACIASVKKRIRQREKALTESPNAHAAAEVQSLQFLRQALAAIVPHDYAKYQALLRRDPRRQAF